MRSPGLTKAWGPAPGRGARREGAPARTGRRGTPRTTGKGKTGVRDGTAAGRLYLDIPYANKEEAKKQLGARWGPARRKWYVDAAKVSREQAACWPSPS
ncbi:MULTISPECIES: DUF5710 domain-containing protein [Streptomyces]|uniref:DUF5710 domain-containing protein n=1 Tax=Streptomyces sp. CC71 TaxID=1770211 RepID=UPI0020921699|nr:MULTISPECIES: DUF5710 domain-containing protein [Streptomyces]